MRRVLVYNRITIDGYFSGPGGSIDWFIQDPMVDKAAHDAMTIDTLLFGRETYEQFEDFWPAMASNPGAPPELRGMAQELTDMTKIVFSRTRTDFSWENSRGVSGDVPTEVKRLKETAGEDLGVFGSGSIVQQLARAGLVDEYVLVATPAILGGGSQLFTDVPQTDLELVGSQRFESGNVLLHYRVA